MHIHVNNLWKTVYPQDFQNFQQNINISTTYVQNLWKLKLKHNTYDSSGKDIYRRMNFNLFHKNHYCQCHNK